MANTNIKRPSRQYNLGTNTDRFLHNVHLNKKKLLTDLFLACNRDALSTLILL